jgi:Zn-dependent protease with chaperone function
VCGNQTLLFVPTPEEAAAPVGEDRPGPWTTANVIAAFQGPVPRTRTSFLYQIALATVALTMVVLPLVYLALLGAAGWAVYWWAIHGTFLFHGGGGGRILIVKGLVYVVPLFAGVVTVFFMIKPLLARRAPQAEPLALNPSAEPVLFTLICQICQAVGAPLPTRIFLDCQVNAAAGFRRGALSFLGNDLVLVIGLPLVAGISAREFAGVLAHEFGHFAQGFGMRTSYVIRRINSWFERVAYERTPGTCD